MSQVTSLRNNKGFTLVEVMVAVLIAVIGMFGVLESLNVSLQHNLKNELRNEAIKVGERYMADLRGKNFDRISSAYTPTTVVSKIRGGTRDFRVERTAQEMAKDSFNRPTTLQLSVVVKWAFKNVSSQNRVVTVLAKP